MPVRTKPNAQSGFMSVEAITTTLFYLIMVAIVTLIGSRLMNTGKMASALSSLTMLRSNLQYVGTNAGSYEKIGELVPSTLVPGLISGTTKAKGTLPTGHVIDIAAGTTSDYDENGVQLTTDNQYRYFTIKVNKAGPEECRRIAYYGKGGGYGVVVDATKVVTATMIENIETGCGTDEADPKDVILTSR